jgi:NTP pyrophosphatase (non-canonical NTP hydrolase)
MNNDLTDLLERCRRFRDARDWQQFHSIFNLIVSLNLEAAELLEFTQWKNATQLAREILEQPEQKAALAAECADVLMYLLMLADAAEIDLHQAVLDKMALNEQRYPVDKARGRSDKYSALE